VIVSGSSRRVCFSTPVSRLVLEPWMLPEGSSTPLCSNYEGLIHYKYQNGARWVVSDVIMIAQVVSPRSCEPIHPLVASSRTHPCSAFAAAYPDDVVDERFAVHWYNCLSGVLVSLLVISLKVDMARPGRRGQSQRCRNKHSPHSRKHAPSRCPFSRPHPTCSLSSVTGS
jgi:hypothetical protein